MNTDTGRYIDYNNHMEAHRQTGNGLTDIKTYRQQDRDKDGTTILRQTGRLTERQTDKSTAKLDR